MRKILFIRLRLLGDTIFTIPAIQIYKKHFPDSLVYYLVEEKFRELAWLMPGIHEVILIPYRMGLRDLFKFRKEIMGLGIDTVVDFHCGPKAALLTCISGAKVRIGYRTPNRNWAYNHLTPRKFADGYTHSVYNQAKLLEHLGIAVVPDRMPAYPEIRVDERQAAGFVKEASKGDKKLVVHVGAGNIYRDWGIENFLSLIQKIKGYKDGSIEVFLIGSSQEEREKGAYLRNECDACDFTGQLSIPEILYLISNSTVYFGVDSGPLHLASLTQTPIVALYGPNIPAVSGPWRKDNVTIIQSGLSCRPCSQRGCKYDTIRCMKEIKTDEVYEAIIRYFK